MAANAPMLGIDLGGTKTEAALLGADGTELWRRRVPTPAGDYEGTVRTVAALAAAAAEAAGGAASSIGIGTPGALAAGGLMKNCNSTCLNGRPLQRDLEAALGRAIAIANDANCLALSEATDGAGAGFEVVFAAILGTGVGAGIAVRGQVLGGPNRLAGEWGHNPLPWLGADEPRPHCYCGQRGCVETLVSGSGLARDHALVTGQALSGEEIASRAAAADAASAATLERHADRLARALAAVVNLLDPDVIVLGGGLSRLAHLYEQVPARWSRWVFGGTAERVRTRLVPARHGDASGVRGAAWLGRAAAAAAAAHART
ncbi:MAG: ROK family protein [Rubrivivax sp.]